MESRATDLHTLSLHDALPIYVVGSQLLAKTLEIGPGRGCVARPALGEEDRKSTRLNSSHGYISYAVFCLKKKNIAMLGFEFTLLSFIFALHCADSNSICLLID